MWEIKQGDALSVLKTMPEQSVHCCVTSPPYWGLRDYGVDGQLGLESTPDEYVEKMVEVFREVRRVLRDDGTLWLNLGDSYMGSWGNYAPTGKGGQRAKQVERWQRGAYEGKEDWRPPTSMKQEGIKPKDLVGIPWMVAFALRTDGWYLRQDIIWCLSGGTRVYVKTQKGEMPMTIKDLVRLDPSTVRLWNGEKWTRVLGWSQTPRPDVAYEIELRSGERIGCTAGHVWPTERENVRTDELQVGDVIKTCRLPEPENVKQPSGLDDELVGWFVGLYIAEGSRSGDAIQIASHTQELERFEKLKNVAEAYHGTCRMHKTGGNAATINLYGHVLTGILDTYVSGRTAKDKHLSVRCWQRSDGFLMAVLKGYLSGDGHYDEANDRYRIAFTNNDNWAADLRTLCARLGVSLRLKRAKNTINGREFPGYRGQIRLSVSDHHNNKPDGEIVAIRRSRARQFWDIGVEDEPHLFALASGVLTHNSKPNAMPESVKDRCTKAHEYIFLLTKNSKYYFNSDLIREPNQDKYDGKRGPTKTRTKFQSAMRTMSDKEEMKKYSTQGRNKRTVWSVEEQIDFIETLSDELECYGIDKNIIEEALFNSCIMKFGTVWNIPTKPFKEAHFATYPPDLIEPCILAGCPEGGVVLDPFVGSGTTLLVATRHHRRSIGIELNPEYIEIAKRRLDSVQLKLVME